MRMRMRIDVRERDMRREGERWRFCRKVAFRLRVIRYPLVGCLNDVAIWRDINLSCTNYLSGLAFANIGHSIPGSKIRQYGKDSPDIKPRGDETIAS
jgi:hypothetical protein